MSRLKSRRGQGLVEYVLILVLMGVLSVGALRYLGAKTHNGFSQAGTALEDEMTFSHENAHNHGEVETD